MTTTIEPHGRPRAGFHDQPGSRTRTAGVVWCGSALCIAIALLSVGAGCGKDGTAANAPRSDGGPTDRASTVLVRGAGMLDGATPTPPTDPAVVLGSMDGSAGTGGIPSNGVDASTPAAVDGAMDGASEAMPTATGCSPPVESKVCDPVCDTGCGALQRCDVTDAPHTGSCVGVWISGEGDLCLRTAISEPCAAHLTCVDGACRRLCYRDSDCASPGTCCGQDLLLQGQASGYKICVPCAH